MAENLTDYPERIAVSDAVLLNEGWIHGAGESQVLFVVEVKGRSCGYLTVAQTSDTLWIRELYLDGRTWRGRSQGETYPVLHRGLGKLILTYFYEDARRHGRILGIFTTRSLGLLKACDHLFGDRCQYHVTEGDPPQTLFRQRGLRWLESIEHYSASLPPRSILLFEKVGEEFVDSRTPGETYRLEVDASRILKAHHLQSDRVYGPEDGLLVSIGPSVDILVLQ